MDFKIQLVVAVAALMTIIKGVISGSFSCQNRPQGYYADTSSECEVYHMCDGLGRRFSYRCPNDTLFQQRMLICDHWYMVNCSRAEEDYSANLLIGQRNTPFVREFQRTPRPDLADLSNPVNLQNYREREKKRKTQSYSFDNIVGEEENTIRISSDESKYFPPTHWSTEYSVESSTKSDLPNTIRRSQTGQTYYKTSYNTINRFKNENGAINSNNKVFEPNKPSRQNPRGDQGGSNFKVNFPSSFKATTPVYPKEVVGVDLSKFYGIDEKFSTTDIVEGAIVKDNQNFFNPTKPNQPNQSDTEESSNPNFKVNFPSNYKATTPVYPKEVVGVDLGKFYDTGDEIISEKQDSDEERVYFQSSYKGTTPVYPKEVIGVDLSKFSGIEEDPPASNPRKIVVNFQSNYKGTTPVYPKEVIGVDLSKFSGIEEDPPASNPRKIVVNFQSNYKGTTPVYPKEVVGVDLNKFSGSEESAPEFGAANSVNFQSNFKETTPVYPKEVLGVHLNKFVGDKEVSPEFSVNNRQNFQSSFKGTTPVYPKAVEPTSPKPDEVGLLPPLFKTFSNNKQPGNQDNRVNVNFQSNYIGTTPVYPDFVDATSPNPNEFGLLPPKRNGAQEKSLSIDREFIEGFDAPRPTFTKRQFRKPNKLEIVLDGEDIEESVLKNTFNSKQLTEYMLSMNPEELKELRGQFHIPEYDFPLETVNRPSYETVFSSYKSDSNVKSER